MYSFHSFHFFLILSKESFLNWRRTLAKLEEELLIERTFTPFEKNLEVWKQLWRVVEKADIVVQVQIHFRK